MKHQEVFPFPKGQIALSRKTSWEAPVQSSGEVFVLLLPLQFYSEGSFDVQLTRTRTLFHELLGFSAFIILWCGQTSEHIQALIPSFFNL